MLILSRKQGEEVVIGDNVHITVVAVQGNRMKLGITAPRDVVIRRAELNESRELPAAPLAAVQGGSPQVVMAVVQQG